MVVKFGQRWMTGESLFRRLRWPGVVESFVEPRVRIPLSPLRRRRVVFPMELQLSYESSYAAFGSARSLGSCGPQIQFGLVLYRALKFRGTKILFSLERSRSRAKANSLHSRGWTAYQRS